jgi:hypothetical protein
MQRVAALEVEATRANVAASQLEEVLRARALLEADVARLQVKLTNTTSCLSW